MNTISPSKIQRFDLATNYEWLETNGIGGYASSTIIGAHTRRYHGLLVAALQPPVGRTVLLSKLDETLIVGDKRFELGANKYRGAVYPNGYIFQQEFTKGLFPEFTYHANGVILKKTIVAIHGENTTLVLYEVLEAESPFTMELLPLTAPRDYHALSHVRHDQAATIDFNADNNQLYIQTYPENPGVYISAPNSSFVHGPDWYYQLEYSEEMARGMDAHEDLFSPGKLYVNLEKGDKWGVIISADYIENKNAITLYDKEKARRKKLIKDVEPLGTEAILPQLALAADQFIVDRDENKKTIIAGYHWFSDWGRDTMISMPGLCFATGRWDDARKILFAYAKHVSQGMIPNRFPDNGQTPEYHTIDASLWYFVAVYKYLRETWDIATVKSLRPYLKEILEAHQTGTRFNIKMEEDGLLSGGDGKLPLTWMDARAGDWTVTPRVGKAVEINALWYNAWEIYSFISHKVGEEKEAYKASEKARGIRKQFVKQFWNRDKGYLFDYIQGEYKDDALRPNQIFAISLPFPLLNGEKAEKILMHIEEGLFTEMGLRTLAPEHQNYKGFYQGDTYERDGAYHQGTVWGWLLGPFIDAAIKYKGIWGRELAKMIIRRMAEHLDEAGLGSISEVFDGAYPHQPRGCIAQAWSIGELLRVCHEYKLFSKSRKTKKEGNNSRMKTNPFSIAALL